MEERRGRAGGREGGGIGIGFSVCIAHLTSGGARGGGAHAEGM